jgi:hypothetical protein
MRDWVEYEFILPDGSSRYEIIDLNVPARPQMWAFIRMHKSVLAWPVERAEKMADYRARLIKRLKRKADARARVSTATEGALPVLGRDEIG